jgi:hypothetical protein
MRLGEGIGARRVASRLAAAAIGWAVAGCGASIQAVYEGDVRFEHCMALDAQPTVKPVIRRACWVEWLAFYTYGQTRDRVLHAQGRVEQLGVEPSQAGTAVGANGGAPQAVSGLPPERAVASDADQSGRCADECRVSHDDCSRACSTPTCRWSCLVEFRGCVRRCS